MHNADILDDAAELEQQMIEIALTNRKRPEMQFTGACYYCEEAVSTGASAMKTAAAIMSVLSALSSIGEWHEH